MKLNKYILMSSIALAAVGMTTTSCDDRDDEITSISYSRLFSALNLEARVQNQINVRLSWYEVAGAESYIVNVYESVNQEGEDGDATDNTQFVRVPEGATPVRVCEGITAKQLPYMIEGLTGQTRYVFEVIAVDANGGRSKGICVEAKTGAEQSFRTVDEAEIEANSVVLRWNAADAQGCTIKVQVKGEEGYVVQHEITADEAAAKAAKIEGLTGETTYVAYLKNASNKQRGEVEFTTAIDLGDAIAVTPEDNLKQVIADAPAGSTLALFPGTYSIVNEEGALNKIVINKSLSIKAVRPAERPVINGCIHLTEGASLVLSQVVLDGAGTDGSQAIEWKDAVEYNTLTIEDCEVKNYTKGFFYINVAATIESININNCLIHDIVCSGGDMFDCRAGAYKAFNLTNSTIYNSAAERDLIRFDDKSSNFPGIEPVVTVDHCTFYKVGNGGANYRLLYVRFAGNIINFTNNVVAEFNNKRGFANQKTTAIPTFKNNYYYNTINLMSLDEANGDASITCFDTEGKALSANPFKDAEKGDFTVTNEDMVFYGIGDPRWTK